MSPSTASAPRSKASHNFRVSKPDQLSPMAANEPSHAGTHVDERNVVSAAAFVGQLSARIPRSRGRCPSAWSFSRRTCPCIIERLAQGAAATINAFLRLLRALSRWRVATTTAFTPPAAAVAGALPPWVVVLPAIAAAAGALQPGSPRGRVHVNSAPDGLLSARALLTQRAPYGLSDRYRGHGWGAVAITPSLCMFAATTVRLLGDGGFPAVAENSPPLVGVVWKLEMRAKA